MTRGRQQPSLCVAMSRANVDKVSRDGQVLLRAVGVVTKAPSSANNVGIMLRKQSAVEKI